MTRQVLEVDTCTPYLTGRGLTSADALLDGGCRVLDVSRRNANFKVIPAASTGFLVKQVSEVDDKDLVEVLKSEAATLDVIQRHPALARVRACAPRMVDYNEEALAMVTELIHPATSLTKLHLNGGQIRFDETVSAIAGKTLALFQVGFIRAHATGSAWHLRTRHPHTTRLKQAIAGEAERGSKSAAAFQQLASTTKLWTREAEVKQQWDRHGGFFHGDIRWDNFLLAAGRGPLGPYNLRIIDWEFAALGDGLWDVSCYLADFLRFQALTMIPEAGTGGQVNLKPSFSSSQCKAAATAFLDAYEKSHGLLDDGWRQRLRLQTAWTALYVAWELTNNNAKYGQSDTLPPTVRDLVTLADRLHQDDGAWGAWFP